ncbi:bifunctional 23S rRNA (guanine(2069)-N(7))-methyltransferase RlmK/23S rRNA (guanine(2445)-N(2))-methyltransferase RlmL [Hydrocarboniphaga sp.]|uniref:bifunctional 23S rRNA (guanine(2069)-N(7))-methyltransferase RlmK/23S rRNA (guanine(2445)-N(2))-methyltransferase RlmL n=1 Tax=Hydrocarboniphaga sp. TaxID=2033016 RepID=UPI00262BADAD|nr:bifunctional 23S rRNA (guanine(2069)-N(7))-methyltransferase RlmK/23S rRNA (guanine(2445)-N(2))-methyltransferase RlmL [Hydrocarboniphaga sp.]
MSLLPLFATCPRGVEPLLATELTALGASDCRERKGGIAFSGDLNAAYRACLWSRLANRILMPLNSFPLADSDALYEGAKAIDWPGLFALERTFAIEVAGHSPAVTHTHYAGLKVKDAIADRFRERHGERPNVDTDAPDIRIHVHLERSQATLSLDLSGESLHKRGYRVAGGEAPLKENLAAAILIRSGWAEIAAAGGALLDPMCGSGTLLIEGAMIAADIAPGLKRAKYGFEAWSGHDAALWQTIRAEASGRKSAGLARLPAIVGSDIDDNALRSAHLNADRAGLLGPIRFEQRDALEARPIAATGLVATNPPYGERLGSESEIIKLYSLFGATLKHYFAGWRATVFTSRPDLSPRLGLRASQMHTLFNGAIECKLLQFEMATRVVPTGMDAQPPTITGGEDFANRLRKSLKHLGKWAKRGGIHNYRVYDADLPDYALAIDLYEVGNGTPDLHVHVQEYAAPDTIDPIKAERRLREALAQLQAILAVPASRIHYKLRKSQKGSAQYQKQDESREFMSVVEHGCKLWVNFEDYLDTGLFLDHRPMRLRIQKECEDKRFLNLFCYTGSATVHAAKGGASHTTSVDLSKTYLDWADRNLLLNGFDTRGPWNTHQLIRADAMAWLAEQAGDPRAPRYDLIFCDPPTFSNSKSMEGVLDTQADHAGMIRNAVALLAPAGKLYFSTNRRRFKLDEALSTEFKVNEITAQTLDEDFKRPPPSHRSWSIERS